MALFLEGPKPRLVRQLFRRPKVACDNSRQKLKVIEHPLILFGFLVPTALLPGQPLFFIFF